MKEKLYTIPVNDAFKEECECPICVMYRDLEEDALRYAMSGYMVEERRAESDKVGFCNRHMDMLFAGEDRLALAWMIKTHMEYMIQQTKERQKAPVKQVSLFKKKMDPSELSEYMRYISESCYVCDKINRTFGRYMTTIFHLYKKEEAFRELFRGSKGFCAKHYGLLHELAPANLAGEQLQQFIKELDELYIVNIQRVCDDVSWFINKYDYRYKDEPWKNAKDSISRAMVKLDSIVLPKQNQ